MTTRTSTPARTGKAPSHIVWFVPEREGVPLDPHRRCWPTKTGKGLRLALELAPLAPGSLLGRAEGEQKRVSVSDRCGRGLW